MKKKLMMLLLASSLVLSVALTGCSIKKASHSTADTISGSEKEEDQPGSSSAKSSNLSAKSSASDSKTSQDQSSVSKSSTSVSEKNSIQSESVSSGKKDSPNGSASALDPALKTALDQINTGTDPGTAGSSLRSAYASAALLDFASSTTLSAADISKQTSIYVQQFSENQRSEFLDKVSMVGETIISLRDGGEDGKALLEDAGAVNSGYPWSPAVYEKALAVLSGAGV